MASTPRDRRLVIALIIGLAYCTAASSADNGIATVSNECPRSAAYYNNSAVLDSNCCRLSLPAGFDLIPTGEVSKRLIIPLGDANLQLSPYKRPRDVQPTYYIAGHGRAVVASTKQMQPGSFDYNAHASGGMSDEAKEAPAAVMHVSNIRLSGVAGGVEFMFHPLATDAHTSISFLLLLPCCERGTANSTDPGVEAGKASSPTDERPLVSQSPPPRGCFAEIAFAFVEPRT